MATMVFHQPTSMITWPSSEIWSTVVTNGTFHLNARGFNVTGFGSFIRATPTSGPWHGVVSTLMIDDTDAGTEANVTITNFAVVLGDVEYEARAFSQFIGRVLAFNDTITGSSGGDYILALDGNDTVNGGSGGDTIEGGNGADTLYGEADADTLVGGMGDDAVDAGVGDDRLFGNDGDDFLNGEAGSDQIQGNSGADQLFGRDGNDVLTGAAGNDVLHGDNNDDALLGGVGNDFIYGGSGVDVMWGNDGADAFDGGTGNDFLDGGAGNDLFIGNTGNDTFIFGPGFGEDRILDFQAGAGAGDVVVFSKTVFTDIFDLMAHASQFGADTVIANQAGEVLLLANVNRASLSPDDFQFV